jgi:two-component system cell cycle sensor histidine kinase/response regulator CckA
VTGSFTAWADLLPEVSILVSAKDTEILALNRAAARQLNDSAAALVGRSLAELLAVPVEEFTAYLKRALRSSGLIPGTLRLRGEDADGERAPVRCKAARFPDGEGVVLLRLETSDAGASRFVLLNRKIEELARENERRRKAEEAMRESQVSLAAFLEHSPAGVYLKDEQARILLANQTFAAFLGRPLEALLGRSVEELLPPEIARWDAELDATLRAGTSSTSDEVRVTTRQGERHLLVHRFLLPEPGRERPLIGGICTDITELKRMEAERRRLDEKFREAQKMESLGVLAGGVAHDFNNLLTGMIANGEMALEDLEPGGDGHSCVSDILLASRRAAEICDQMLTYAGRSPKVMQTVDVSRLTREMVQLVDASLSRNARLRLELHPSLPAVHADPAQLRQVIMNLVINASKALVDGRGDITIQTRAADDRVQIEVADTGCGMDEATRSRIFEPFFTTRSSGRGLGLASVLGIVRSHGGSIDVESAPGEGTRFLISLPMSQPAGDEGDSADGAGGRGKVLLADDDPLILSSMRRVLERAGFSVVTARDGLEAVEIFRERRGEIGLILMDVRMPNLSGPEALAQIHRVSPEIPAVLASGYTGANDQLERPGVWFMQKPFQMEALVSLLREIA